MRRLFTFAGVSAALIALGATAAFASGPPYTVKVGAATTGTFGTSLAATGSTTSVIGTVTLTCTGLSATGSTSAGTARTTVTTITSSTGSGCTTNPSVGGSLVVVQSGTAVVRGTGTTATSGTSDVVASSVDNLDLIFQTSANPSVCKFRLTGSAAASFNEGTQRVVVSQGSTGGLAVTLISGCLGRIQSGQTASLSTTLALTVPNPSGALVRLS